MSIENIAVTKDHDISQDGNEFYTICINGEVVLECVAYKDVGTAISSFMRNPKLFKELFQ